MREPDKKDFGKCSASHDGYHNWLQNTRHSDKEDGPGGQHDGGSHFYERWICCYCDKKTPWRKVY